MGRTRFAAFAAVALTFACGDGGNGPSPSEFAGTWDATKLEFTNTANPSQKVEVISQGGTLVVVMEKSGDYQSTITIPGSAPEVASGTWSASSDIFTLKETGGSGDMQFDYTLSGNKLTLSGANTGFDFNSDGTDEAAKLSVVLVRR